MAWAARSRSFMVARVSDDPRMTGCAALSLAGANTH